jgi:hypothetical protein
MRRLGVLRSADAGDPKGKANFLHSQRSLQYWVGPMAPFANGDSLGWRQRQSGIGFCQRVGRPTAGCDPWQGAPVTAALKQETRTIPIVFATVLAKRRAETYDCVETC